MLNFNLFPLGDDANLQGAGLLDGRGTEDVTGLVGAEEVQTDVGSTADVVGGVGNISDVVGDGLGLEGTGVELEVDSVDVTVLLDCSTTELVPVTIVLRVADGKFVVEELDTRRGPVQGKTHLEAFSR